MNDYSVDIRMNDSNKVFRDGEYFGDDGLTKEQAIEMAGGYLTYNGRIRIFKGMKLIVEYTTTHNNRFK